MRPKSLELYSISSSLSSEEILEPLSEMRPKNLNLHHFPDVFSFTHILNMRPESLILNHFPSISSLEPLREILKGVKSCTLNYFPLIESLEPLRDMRPESLDLRFFPDVSSLEPLRNMRPESLKLTYFPLVESVEPLRELCLSMELFKCQKMSPFPKVKTFEDYLQNQPKNFILKDFPKVPSLRFESSS